MGKNKQLHSISRFKAGDAKLSVYFGKQKNKCLFKAVKEKNRTEVQIGASRVRAFSVLKKREMSI